jgi:hypothetical protein
MFFRLCLHYAAPALLQGLTLAAIFAGAAMQRDKLKRAEEKVSYYLLTTWSLSDNGVTFRICHNFSG